MKKEKSQLLLILCACSFGMFVTGFFITACQNNQIQSTVYTPVTLVWEKDHPERLNWSRELRTQVRLKLVDFVKAKDWDLFCPKFKSLTDDQKVDAISTMAVGMALFESSYKAETVYHEPPPLGVDSVGLFQLSYEDNMKWCSMNKAKGNLKDALVNIQCAVPMMAKLISQDGVVRSGDKLPRNERKGVSRYWSVTWPSKHLKEISASVKSLSFCK
jgi:hypothetical protein